MIPTADGLIGKDFGGYQLERLIGTGGAAAVFLARQIEEPHAQVAIKVLLPPTLPTMSQTQLADFRARFTREARTLSQQLEHPHILRVLSAGEDEATGLAYMVMPYMSGGTLASLVTRGQLRLGQVANYVTQLATALDYAHSKNVVHRDLKPANVLLDEHNQVYLSDFGIAKLFDLTNTTLTDTGRVMGTPEYMAPEQARGETVTNATDIYALGMVAYHLVTGKLPFHATTWPMMMMQVLSKVPDRPRSFRPDLPEPAETVIMRAIAKEPSQRFASAGELARAFEVGIRGEWAPGMTPEMTAIFTTPPTITPPPREMYGAAAGPSTPLQMPSQMPSQMPGQVPGQPSGPYQGQAPWPYQAPPSMPLQPGQVSGGPYPPTPPYSGPPTPGYAPPSTPLYPMAAPPSTPLYPVAQQPVPWVESQPPKPKRNVPLLAGIGAAALVVLLTGTLLLVLANRPGTSIAAIPTNTPVQPTATDAPTPTPTPLTSYTAAIPGENCGSSGWSTASGLKGIAQCTASGLRLTHPGDNSNFTEVFWNGADSPTSYSTSVTVQLSQACGGLGFQDGYKGYFGFLCADGVWRLTRYDSTGTPTVVDHGQLSAQTSAHIEMVVTSSTVTFREGASTLTVQPLADGYDTQSIGLGLYAYGGPGEGTFSDFRFGRDT